MRLLSHELMAAPKARGRARCSIRRCGFPVSWREVGEEVGQVLGRVVDVLGQAAPFAHLRLRRVIHIIGMHENGRHAERVGGFEVVRHVLEHGGLGAGNGMPIGHALEGVGRRLGDEIAGGDVANIFHQVQHAELLGDTLCVAA